PPLPLVQSAQANLSNLISDEQTGIGGESDITVIRPQEYALSIEQDAQPFRKLIPRLSFQRQHVEIGIDRPLPVTDQARLNARLQDRRLGKHPLLQARPAKNGEGELIFKIAVIDRVQRI